MTTMTSLTNELLDDAEGHDDERHAEVGHRQRHEEVVSYALKFAFDSDGDADEHVTGHSRRHQGEQEQYLPATLDDRRWGLGADRQGLVTAGGSRQRRRGDVGRCHG